MRQWEPPEFTRRRRAEGLALILCAAMVLAAVVYGLLATGVVR